MKQSAPRYLYRRFAVLLVFLIGCLSALGPAMARDMRQATIAAEAAKAQLAEKAAAEREAARAEAAAARAAIARDRGALQQALDALERQNAQLSESITRLAADSARLNDEEQALSEQLAATDGMVRELVGVIRVSAKDLTRLVEQSPKMVLNGADTTFLDHIADQAVFPGMADVRRMAHLLRQAIRAGGEVSLTQGDIVDRSGRATTAEILMIGNFTGAYRLGEEIGFLIHTPGSKHLYALSRLPDAGMRKRLVRYMAGESEAVPMDVSRGGALRQLTHQSSLWRQVPNGGPLVWPILAILAVGLVLIAERIFYLWRKRTDGGALLAQVAAAAADRGWDRCRTVCQRLSAKPLARVMAAGLGCRDLAREEMENALQEAILREVPAMERFLSTLGMLAAIAPLLGLLGTVIGMIDTFHVITQHGTGDPRMMSGGISEALVTTMLGLAVAIPLMLAHTLLNRAVDTRIGEMEEKAVGLVNIVQKSRLEVN